MNAVQKLRAAAHVVGVAILDEKGATLHSSGLATTVQARTQLADRGWIGELEVRRLLPLELDGGQYVAYLCHMRQGMLIVFSEPVSDEVFRFLTSVDFAYDLLDHFLTNQHEAIMVADRSDKVVYFSPVHEKFFGLEPGGATGRLTTEIAASSRLQEVMQSGKAQIAQLARIRGTERIVSRIPIRRDGEVIGAMARVLFESPRELEELNKRINFLEKEVEWHKREAASAKGNRYQLENLIGESAVMKRLRAEITKVAPLDVPVLITGESGTGKELIAHSLHTLSARKSGPLVFVNSAALPPTLVEAELFGYEAGAFTGADRKGRKGKFEQASEGSLFLDEIGDMPIEIQVKLLRVLQDKLVERVGGDRPRQIDFRLISATNCDLNGLIDKGRFRLDLYYRISSIVISVPPLRSRVEDIPLLAQVFLSDVAKRHDMPTPEITDGALNILSQQSWPGNVRQLRHELERAFFFAENGRIGAEDFSFEGSSHAAAVSSEPLFPKVGAAEKPHCPD